MENENNQQNNRVKKVENFLLDPEKVTFESLEEFKIALDTLIPLLQGVNLAELETLQGEDGYTPVRGVDYMTDDDINALETFILSRMPVAGVDYATLQTTIQLVKDEVAKIPRIKGDRGETGARGKDGKDGSPDTGADIMRKIRALGKNQGLQIKDIRGLQGRLDLLKVFEDDITALRKEFGEVKVIFPASGNGGGGINNITGLITAGTNISITGNGTSGSPYVINSIAGGTGTVTSVSVASANGFTGTVATATTTPAITIRTSVTGILQGNGTAISAITVGSGLDFTGGTLTATNTSTGTVTSVAMTVPTGLTIGGSPITTTGTLALALDTGYVIPLQTTIDSKITNPMTTGGDIIYGGASGTPTRLANGSAGQVLTSNGTTLAPTWETVGGGANTALSNLASVAINTSLISDTTNTDDLGSSSVLWANLFVTNIGATATRVTKGWFTDIESTNIPTVGGVALPTATSTTTFINKRVQPRSSTAASGDITPDLATANIWQRTGLTAGITINAPTGTPVLGEVLVFMLLDDGTSRSLTWNSAFTTRVMGEALPTATTIGKQLLVTAQYNGTTWLALSVEEQ